MSGISSDLICRVVGRYRFSSDDADYRRYLQLEDFLGGGGEVKPVGDSREAATSEERDTDVMLEKKKVHKYKGEGGVAAGVSKKLREVLEPYLPFQYFRDDPGAKEMLDNFYRMAYAQFRDTLPKMIASKLKDFNIDKSEREIETDPETLYNVIMDSVIYLDDHPDILRDGLVRAYRRREDEENRGLSIADAFFVPRIDAGTLKERLKREDGEDVKEGDADTEVLADLERMKDEGKDVVWKWRGIDQNGILKFTLPKLYGSREFMVKLPAEIQTIEPGTYRFKVKDVAGTRGAIIEFKDQHENISGNALESISEDGLGQDQWRKFIYNGVIYRYANYLRSQPASKLAEDLLGTFSVGPREISDAQDLAQLIRDEGGAETSKGRGADKVKEKYQKSVSNEREKLQAMIDRWSRAPEVAKHFMKVTEADGARIARVVASKFSQISEKGVPSLASILATAPVVEMVLRKIMSPHMPLSGGGSSAPWIHFAWDAFQKMALKEPSVRSGMESMVRHKRKDVPGSSVPVTDEEIISLFSSLGTSTVNKSFFDLKKKIGQAIEASREAPELKKFFERRDVFRTYAGKILGDEIYNYMDDNNLSLSDPKDMKTIEKYYRTRINKLIQAMEKGTRFKGKSEQDIADQVKAEQKRVREEMKKDKEQVNVQMEQRPSPVEAPQVAKQSSSSSIDRMIHQVMLRMSSRMSASL